MKLLVTGASGDLGRPLTRLASLSWPVTGTYLSNPRIGGGNPAQLDLCNRRDVLELAFREEPSVIIHAAVSDRSQPVTETHKLAAKHIAEVATTIGARLIALSSDMVFDGTNGPYSEKSPPTPTSTYGQAKYEVEQHLLETVPGCVIVRTSLIYEFTYENRQVSWMTDQIAAKKPIPLFVDEIRHPIHATNLAECLLELSANTTTGIIQIAGPQALSRLDYGSHLLSIMGYDPLEHVVQVRAAEVAPKRPRNLTIILDKARNCLQTPLLSVQEAAFRYPPQGQRTETTTSL